MTPAERRADAERFLREAVRLATQSVDVGGGPFACVVVRDGRVVARGRNRVRELGDPTAHAEIVAIREACAALGDFQLRDCELYCSSEPCPMCLGAIYWARPAAVLFANPREVAASAGFDDGLIYAEIARAPADRRIPMRRMQIEEADEPFRRWRDREDRAEY